VPLINGVLDSRNHQAQRAAALVLIEAGVINDQSASTISSWLDSPDWELRHCAVYALHCMDDEDHVARSLITKLSDQNESVREAAADILASKLENSDSSFTMLLELMYDPSVEVREGAFRALLSYPDKSDKRLITGLCEKLNDESSSIRKKAAEFLGDSRTKSSLAIQALLVRLNDDMPEVRLAVATALGNLGLSTNKIIKPLESVAKNDPDEEVRHCAESVLRELVGTDVSSADSLGEAVSLNNVDLLTRVLKPSRLFKPSAVVQQRPI
jgi:HEAT repeat protein